jgi:tRNA modification GTPase
VLGPLDPEATIAAIASPPGPALRGIVRLSGPRAWPIALGVMGPELAPPAQTRAAVVRGRLRLDDLPQSLGATASLWRGPRSYTGQDVAEIQTVGSPPLLALVLGACLAGGARHAQPGEFTLRAFLSGRIDLTRAEAVLGVIDARNQAQLDAALRQLAGGISGPIQALRERLLDRLAHLEANLDFVDEADVDVLGRAERVEDLAFDADELEALAERLRRRDRASRRPRVVLTGAPNAGKSRLFNALAGNDHAIVSPVAGTTRDYLSAICRCEGLTVELVDTAGTETAAGPIEAQAQQLRRLQAEAADLLLVCSAADAPLRSGDAPESPCPILRVRTKCDLAGAGDDGHAADVETSAATGEGLDRLRGAIAAALRAGDSEGDLPASTAARCRESLLGAIQSLRAAASALELGAGEELVAFELRLALDELGKVLGVVVTDDILDRIFRRFCIGK